MDRIHMDNCEGCKKPLFEDDLVHSYDDGPTLCEACAPTFAELKIEYEGFAKEGIIAEIFGSKADADAALRYVSLKVDLGDGDKKHVWAIGKDVRQASQ